MVMSRKERVNVRGTQMMMTKKEQKEETLESSSKGLYERFLENQERLSWQSRMQ
jgi:hypothetical protein